MRLARKFSQTGLYHIMTRGINKQNLFIDDSDRNYFLKLMDKYNLKYKIEIHFSVLMDNHIHLLINDPENNISAYMQVIESIYARYFNKKYDRIGSLFQSRFVSEPILDDKYYKTVIRYILQNPLKAGLSKSLNYQWSTYKKYKENSSYRKHILKYFDTIDNFFQFINQNSDDECIDIELRIKELEIKRINKIKKILNLKSPMINPEQPLELIKMQVRKLRNAGFSIRSISRITGIMTWIVAQS